MSRIIKIEGCRSCCPYEKDWICELTDKDTELEGILDSCPLDAAATPPPRTYDQGAKECEWEKEDEDSRGEFWRPSCDPPIYYFNGPIEFYQFKICPYCGKPLRALPTQPEGEGGGDK